jgi:hypothetical protein
LSYEFIESISRSMIEDISTSISKIEDVVNINSKMRLSKPVVDGSYGRPGQIVVQYTILNGKAGSTCKCVQFVGSNFCVPYLFSLENKRNTIITSSDDSSATTTLREAQNSTALSAAAVTSPLAH